ncbi:MAG TPA: hypothetical protein PLE64_09940 [Spirochaetota bacterium]|nr:hypothetical protein [Spirochaetota bacterium]
MSIQISFSKLEKEFMPQFRERITTSEDIVDVQKIFSYTIKEMLQKAFEKEGITINEENIALTSSAPYYTITINNHSINELWNTSDLKDILQRFAEVAHKRYIHLQKHLAKTKMKIRR